MTFRDDSTQLTTVIFRKLKNRGDIIAFFPEEPGDRSPETCSSYMHAGQHGAAAVGFIRQTVTPSYAEFEPLARELTRLGYRLRLALHFSKAHRAARIAQLNRK